MNTKTTIAVLAAMVLFFAGGKNASAAESYSIDTRMSRATFRIKHFGVSYFHGQFFHVSGGFKIDDRNISKSSVSAVIKIDSLDTHDAKRDGHLKSPDFFNAKAFPVMTFKGKKFKKLGGGKIQVVGDLTLHGVKKSVTINLSHVGAGKDPYGGYRSGYEGTFTLKRSDFGMKFMLEALGDQVSVTLSIQGVRK